jgi:predicted dinucleotide-binding enzyme
MTGGDGFGGPMRRRVFLASGAALAAWGVAGPTSAAAKPMKIGFIGAGRIGGALGRHWANAGHQVMLSARDLGPVRTLVAEIGHGALAGTPREAAAFGEVVVVAVPYESVPQVGRDYAAELKGKIVLDTCNPKRETFVALTPEAVRLGTGVMDQRYLPGTRLVKAFNCVNFGALKSQAGRSGELAGVLLSSDDPAAMAVAAQLVRDAGFEPVIAGDLKTAKLYDSYTPFHANGIPASKVRAMLELMKEIEVYL